MDWEERADYLRSLPKLERKPYMVGIISDAEQKASQLINGDIEDLHEFVQWLVS